MEKFRALRLSDLLSEEDTEIRENPFQFLNIPKNSSSQEVRSAYIRLSKLYHPDMIKLDAKEKIRAQAHTKMVLLNKAYQEIKSRHDPQEWNTLFGYTFADTGDGTKEVFLEGFGKIQIYPKHTAEHTNYWVGGAYLDFCPHPWSNRVYRDKYGFTHRINVKHLFAAIELRQNGKINPSLLKPLIDCFGLEKNADTLLNMLETGESSFDIVYTIINDKKHKFSEDCAHTLRFQLEEITEMRAGPDVYDWPNVNFKFDEGKLILEDAIFSEADYILLSTLAYGPMLVSGKS